MKNTRALIGLGMLAALAQAQTQTVNLRGKVIHNHNGSAVAGVVVTLASDPSITATTDAQGDFALTGEVPVSVAPGGGARPALAWARGELLLAAPSGGEARVEVLGLDGRAVKTLLRRRLGPGEFRLQNPMAGLPAGLYLLRAQVGNQSATFKAAALGGAGAPNLKSDGSASRALAKTAANLDTLHFAKDGFITTRKPISQYQGIHQVEINPKLPAGDIKLISERGMAQVNWGRNVDVQVWDQLGSDGTQLRGDYPGGFEGPTSWMVRFVPEQNYSAWGFVCNNYPEDMSAWANGSMHIAAKGTVHTLGVTMASADQPPGMSVKVELAEYGYKPDNQWHEMLIPMSAFTGTDFSQVTVLLGLVTPGPQDTVGFNQDFFYQVDDVYWKVSK